MSPLPPAAVGTIAGVAVLLGVIGLVTYVTLLERKFAARMQSRIGPYRVGPHGLLQPIADAVKLMMKEDIVPREADKTVFSLAPVIFLIPCLLIFATIPFAPGLGIADLNIGILFFLAVSSMEIVGLFMAVLGVGLGFGGAGVCLLCVPCALCALLCVCCALCVLCAVQCCVL